MKWIYYSLAIWPLYTSALAQTNPPGTAAKARIALVSDTHTTRATNEDQPRYRGRLDKVIAAVNAAKVELVLIAGDLTQNGTPREFADFKQQISGFNATVWFVPGNHDLGNKLVSGKKNEDGLTVFRVDRFEMRFGPSFFARQQGGVRVLGLNSPIFGSGFARETDMWRFLEKQLAQPNPMPTLVLMHYPPFTQDPHEPGDYWNIEPAPRRRLLEMLRAGGVKTVLTGHLHRSLTNRHEGMLFLTTGPVSFGLPRGKQPQGWTLVTMPVEGEAQAEYRPIDD